MRKALLLLAYSLSAYSLKSQNADSIIKSFQSINNSIVAIPCSLGKGNIISNRAMNIFLSNKAGTYLSKFDDLSLYKNSITFNALEGVFSVLHNMRPPKDTDELVKSSLFVGAKANILNGFDAMMNNKHYINDFGALVQRTWMGKAHTYFNKCKTNTGQNQKQAMDALRASVLNMLDAEIKIKDSFFQKSLATLDASQVPGQDLDSAKSIIKTSFYTGLKDEYNLKFAYQQSEALINTVNYRLITSSWTSISAYIPLLAEKFYVANSFASNFKNEYLYPFEILLTHTRFWESATLGRIFFKLNAGISAGNSYYNKSLQKISISDYNSGGGTDSHASQQNSNELLIGNYHTFLTPKLCASLVYIPPEWHLGISGSIEQNFGNYKALNGKIGLPVVIIDKSGDPDITFEIQVNFFDMNNKVEPAIKQSDKTSIGFTIGVPFGKIVY